MRYILEVKDLDNNKMEREISKEEATIMSLNELCIKWFTSDEVEEITCWREFDNIEEAASDNDKCVYYFGDHNGNRTLRSCSASQSRRLWG